VTLVFLGTPDFAVPSLCRLHEAGHEILAVLTQPDRPAGRGQKIQASGVKREAMSRGLPVHQPIHLDANVLETLRRVSPEAVVVVAYGLILPPALLQLPPLGCINLHASLLPRYRGAAPIQWAIARGETETGVTTMLMDAGLDTGPILLQKTIVISGDDTGGTLEARLAPLGADLLLQTLSRWERGDLGPIPQDDAQATLAPRIKKEEALIDWSLLAAEIHCRVRAFDPWPVAFVALESGPLRIWKAKVAPEGGAEATPGRILGIDRDGLVVACGGQTALILENVQPAGKARMTASDFARGKRLAPGDFLGLPKPRKL